SALGGAQQNIQRENVELSLKLKPQINAGDRVKLEVELEISEIASISRERGPTTTKRKVKTVVRVRDNQTVVLGGLLRDSVSKGASKVPLLGDIPLLGLLFRVSTTQKEKRNLLIFLTPHVVQGVHDFRRIFARKMKERKRFLEVMYTRKYKKLRDRIETRPSGVVNRVLHRYYDWKDAQRRRQKQQQREAKQQRKLDQDPAPQEISVPRNNKTTEP
ncbi:MAG: type II and III secretion system protein, partial [Myxococcota bacterium]